jgi:serine O-acetyltransferase
MTASRKNERDREIAAALGASETPLIAMAPPGDDEVAAWIARLRRVVFTEFLEPGACALEERAGLVALLREGLAELLRPASAWERSAVEPDPEPFIESLPEIARLARLDVEAAFEGDPSARSTVEVVVGLPGPRALLVHRAAHRLHGQGHRLLARLLAESAHRETGIDIHPGASIGQSCFIDHGTGVVIGETAKIGDRCRIYQGVTLGARSFPRDEQGALVRGAKRHPTLEDDVVVYANATILGGDTVIGRGSEIAGGAFVTSSVAEGHIAWTPRERPTVRPRVGG